jgi:hypothetical protein
VGLWVASNGDVKIIAVLLPDVPHKINTMLETTLDGFPVVLPCGGIAAQSEDITATRQLRFLRNKLSV